MSALGFDELWARLRTGDETVEIEAKRAEEFGSSLLETISAFANEPGRGGGYLLLGVAIREDSLFPDYEVVGVPDPNRLQGDLASKRRDMFNVPIRPQIEVEQHDGKNVVVAYVPEAQPHEKPVYIKSKGLPRGAFRRIGSTDQHCTVEDVELFYQLRDHRTFDETPVPETTAEAFDPQAMAEYRRARAALNPNAAELAYPDDELLYALAATGTHQGQTCATVAGLILFGKTAALRRHFPMSRVDYIRVEGREWVPDPERRYQAVELVGPLMTLVSRVVGHVLDDIPKAFSLVGEDIHRRDVPLIPRTVIREAIVNALMHRSYRQRQPVQIIRYANRIEIRNPGHSLVPDDRLGEPGSLCRNEKIAAVLHEVGLAETKGTGIRAMREAMTKANLTLPLFESDRERDTFTVTLLVHHLLGPEDLAWLAQFKDCDLTEDEARALIVLREVGAINNAAYRDINHLDTLTASGHLRRLRDLGLLEQKGRGSATYYVPGTRLMPLEQPPILTKPEPLRPGHKALRPELEALRPELPETLRSEVAGVGQRAAPEQLDAVVLHLVTWRPLGLDELSALTGRSPDHLRKRSLKRLLAKGSVAYLYPEEPNHPEQKYLARQDGGN
jgi:ATP-dependent DNA helicase RecG